jgi:hypothetical protein
MTAATFRRLALDLPEAVELAHMGHPDFRVGGRIFATLDAPAKGWAMVKLARVDQARFLAAAPAVFVAAAGAWGRGGATLVKLREADTATVRRALGAAWRERAPAALVEAADAADVG